MMSKKANKISKFFILIFLVLGGIFATQNSQASIRKEFNYQGRLTGNTGANVADGAYDVVFKIYTQAGGGTAAWTESWTATALFTEAITTMTNDGCATGVDQIAYTTGTNESSLKAGQTLWNATTKQSAVIESVVATSDYICIYDPLAAWTMGDEVTNRVYIKNGLFSAMVGSVTNQTVDFTADAYYLGVTVGSDAEMIPRKKIGSVPQAWNTNNIVGSGIMDIDNTSTASDAANINYNPASGAYNALALIYGTAGGTGSALSVTQSGAGTIAVLTNAASSTADAFTLTNLGSGKSLVVNDVANDTTPFTIDASGNVGIGIAVPSAALDINSAFIVNSSGQVTTGTWNGTAIGVTYGGTGLTAYVVGDMLYANTTTGLAKLTIGGSGAIMTSDGTKPQWSLSLTDAQVSDTLTVSSAGSVDAAALKSGTVPSDRLSGTYSGITGLGTLNIATVISVTDNSNSALSVTQSGTGNIVDFKDGATSVFTISDGGNVTVNALSFTQNAVNPVHKGSLADSGTAPALSDARSVYVQGKYAYIASYGDNALEIIDISNPASPAHVGSLVDDTTTKLSGAISVYVQGKYAYVASYTDDSVEIIDISNPAAPSHVGVISDTATTALDGAYSIYVSGKYAYVASEVDDGVEILDISNPASPSHVGAIFESTATATTALDGARSIYVQGKYAYVASSVDDGLEILDISDPSSPSHVGAITDATNLNGATSVYVSGKYAYVACYDSNSLQIINVSNPASPSITGALADSGSLELAGAFSVQVSGKYAYVAGYSDDGVEIVDVSNPASPANAGYIADGAGTLLVGARFVIVQGKYAYIASGGENGLEILDLAGFDIPTASIGDLSVSTIDVTDNASIANNLYVGNGLNVGPGGIYATGPMSTYINSTATALTVSQSGTGTLMDIMDTGVSIFKVGQATVEITRPLDLQVEGDVGMEYNLNFLNNASSYINSAGSLIISAGDTNSYENLTLTTSGTGDVVIDIASSVLGLKVVGLAGQVFSIDPSGNVTIGGTDSGDGNLTVKGNISTQGGNLDLNSLATPAGAGIVVTPTGTAGSTPYGYRISAINGNGETLASTTATTTTGNANLSATNYNRISWGVVPGATGYKVYGRSGTEAYMVTVNAPTLMYDDTGAASPSGLLPTTNTTGGNNITYAPLNGPKRSIILTAAGAEIPATGGPAQTKVAGIILSMFWILIQVPMKVFTGIGRCLTAMTAARLTSHITGKRRRSPRMLFGVSSRWELRQMSTKRLTLHFLRRSAKWTRQQPPLLLWRRLRKRRPLPILLPGNMSP